MDILSALQYEFIRRAIVAGSFIALVCSLLGVLLVLRRFSLIGDGLAHVTFGSVAVGLLFKQHPLSVAVPIVVVSSIGILKLTQKAKIYGDAAIGIVSSLGIALGILVASVSGGFNIDLFSFLFGNILSITETEVYTSIGLSAVVLAMIVFFYNENLAATFDEEIARVSGIDTERINSLLVVLTGITVVLTMKVVGIMLTSSLLILPAVTALQFARSFKGTMIISSCVAVISVVTGIYASFLMNLPTGATIVLMNFFFFVIAFLYKSLVKKRSH
ncbi:MAG: metal ABC transporter permease [Nitrospirota bacterium]